ncbi:protein FAR1-RELATED SEQUENCE 5-like [Olea europaea var. sylvestris]|uniref:protein FAR1-RELATED SEQUENCE 5-like n=1 Tax=Olea europaea var. sylvestris TaxID=158386 RepID=UPI000C1D29E4|nr:protein FAR1-RELATED SEQUENCE 5-like [Olea europaea var. sylvestris]
MSRQAYKEFGDVVTFDTTYLTNKYDMSFAPFVGVNHHGQSTLLGCGLVSNEDTETFVWLFRTWLQCMHGQAPHGIVIDQDRAMQNAIQIVFPNAKYRWCLWHLLKKLLEKFGYHVDKGSIFTIIQVWSTIGCQLLNAVRVCNAFFDGYVHSKMTLKQLVKQYEQALRNKVEKEFQADFKSFSQMEVQEEFTGKMYCSLVSFSDGVSGATYEVREDVIHDEHSRKKAFFFTFQRDKCEISCSCQNFEFRGIICKHMIAVLVRNDVKSIPERYILRRWRRDVTRAHTRVPVNYDGLISTLWQLKYDKMCQRFATLADLTAEDDAKSDAIIDWIDS